MELSDEASRRERTQLDGDFVRVIMNPIRIVQSGNIGKNFSQVAVARISEVKKIGIQCRTGIVAVLPYDEKIISFQNKQVTIRRYGQTIQEAFRRILK